MSNIVNVSLNAPLLSLVAQTGTKNSIDIRNLFGRGFLAMLNVTSLNAGAPTATVALQAKDPVSGLYAQLAITSAITVVVGQNLASFYPGLPNTSPNMSCVVPPDFRIQLVIAGTGSITGVLTGAVLC